MTRKLMLGNEDAGDESDEKQKFVSAINNNELYFYEGIHPNSILLLNKNSPTTPPKNPPQKIAQYHFNSFFMGSLVSSTTIMEGVS